MEPYRKSINLDPTQEFPHEGLAKALFKLARYSDCETELDAAISVYNAQYHGVPTDTFYLMLRNIEQATHNEPALADLHIQSARVYVPEQKFDKALTNIGAAPRAAIYERAGQAESANAARLKANAESQQFDHVVPSSMAAVVNTVGIDIIFAFMSSSGSAPREIGHSLAHAHNKDQSPGPGTVTMSYCQRCGGIEITFLVAT